MEVGLPLISTIWAMLGWSSLEAYALEACLAFSTEATISRFVRHVLAIQHKASAEIFLQHRTDNCFHLVHTGSCSNSSRQCSAAFTVRLRALHCHKTVISHGIQCTTGLGTSACATLQPRTISQRRGHQQTSSSSRLDTTSVKINTKYVR